jgi:tetratricopeptide (TPR) repeat protein
MAVLFLVSSAVATSSSSNTAKVKDDGLPPIEQLQASLKREPGNAKLYVQLGQAYWAAGDYQNAFEALKQGVKLAPSSAAAHNWMGAFLMGRGNLPDAISELRKAVSLDPEYARAHTNLGSALAKSGDLAGAVAEFRKTLVLEPNSWAAHLNLALALRENGDAASALPHLRRVVQAQPKNPTIQCELGQTLRQNGDLAGAGAAFDRALELNPEMREAYYGLGFTLKQQAASSRKSAPQSLAVSQAYRQAQDLVAKGDLAGAKEQLSQALSSDDSDADSHILLGYILGQQGDLPSALPHLERAVALRPESAEVHYNYGAALWYSGSKAKAISELQDSVRLDPSAGASYALLGLAQREQGDLAGARLSLERAIALSPTVAANFIDLGIVFLRQNQLDHALAQFAAGLNAASSEPAPDWDDAITGLRNLHTKTARADVHNVLGLLLGRKGASGEEVLAEFREALKLDPKNPEAHNNIGLVLAQTGEDERALAEFREAIAIRPDYADAHANLGAALMMSDVEQAIGELEKAISLDPTLVTAQFNLAEAYGNSPSHGTAKQIEQLRKIIAMIPDFARAHLALGKALLHDARAPEAVVELRDATRLDPNSGEAHYQLGLALARTGQQEEAAAEVRKGRELSAADDRNQNAEIDLSEGRAALQKGELQEAQAKFEHAVKLQPKSAPAQHFLGIALERQGDNDGAIAAYQKAVELNPGDVSSRQSLARLQPSPQAPERTAVDLSASVRGTSDQDDQTRVAGFEDYIREGKFQEVEPMLTSYVKDHPRSAWGWYALGYSQFAQKKIGDSIKSLAQSLNLDVKNSNAHKILGRDLMAIGRFDAAQTEFEQGIHYAPDSAELHYDLGKLFSIQDNWQAAHQQFEEALSIDPAYLEAMDSLGFSQEALGDDASAVQSYEKVIALNEQNHGKFVSAHVNLSAYYNRTGNPVRALDYAQKALTLDAKSDAAWFQKARAEERQGNLQASADSLNHAISINPRSSSYYYVLSGIYRRLGNVEESKKALDSFTKLDQENNELEKMRRSMSKSRGAPHPGGERE